MSYEIGQFLYVVSSTMSDILPIMVVEEIKRKTLNGQEIVYLVKNTSTQTIVKLTDINGDVFDDLDKVKEYLRTKFESWIDKQIAKTLEVQNNSKNEK